MDGYSHGRAPTAELCTGLSAAGGPAGGPAYACLLMSLLVDVKCILGYFSILNLHASPPDASSIKWAAHLSRCGLEAVLQL